MDGLIWHPTLTPTLTNSNKHSLSMDHVGTISALGYVQASKQQRRFTCISPNLAFAAIVDRCRHVYIYRQPTKISEGCELRNRNTGQKVKKVAKLQVVTMEQDTNNEEVIGALASNTTVFVATKTSLFTIRVM